MLRPGCTVGIVYQESGDGLTEQVMEFGSHDIIAYNSGRRVREDQVNSLV